MLVQNLSGPAQAWFDELPPGSIDSFTHLKEKFQRKFIQHKKAMKTPSEILHLRRRYDENLEQFMTRFINESMRICDCERHST
jgi:hypothetical protein